MVVVEEFWERGRLGYGAERKREENVGKSNKKWRQWRLVVVVVTVREGVD